MKLLALDTSSIACSVALQVDGAIIDRHEEKPREHTRLLMPMIREVLEEAGARLADLDAIVLGNGPGSFIGMRIAASVAQGLAFGSGLDIVPVSSLAAVAAQVFEECEGDEVIVTQDAHMNEVYFGRYRRGEGGMPVAAEAERLQGIERIRGQYDSRPLAAGYGWQRYPELQVLNAESLDAIIPVLHPRARYLLPLGALALEHGEAIDPKALNPTYLRQKVAEKPAPVS